MRWIGMSVCLLLEEEEEETKWSSVAWARGSELLFSDFLCSDTHLSHKLCAESSQTRHAGPTESPQKHLWEADSHRCVTPPFTSWTCRGSSGPKVFLGISISLLPLFDQICRATSHVGSPGAPERWVHTVSHFAETPWSAAGDEMLPWLC